MSLLTPDQLIFLKPVIDLAANLLKPAAQKVWNWSGQAAEKLKYELFGGFETYLRNSYKRHSYFTSLVFKNEQKKLDDFYLPLTLLQHPNATEHQITRFPEEIVTFHKRVLIVDTGGMGKSTIAKFLFLSCVRENKAIPILIELRKLSKTKTILDFIIGNIAILGGDSQKDLIVSLIGAGHFLFLFDGYDEIAEADRVDVASNISEFVASAPENLYVMTSREESSLSAFPDFQRFTIKPLQKEEAYKLLRLYDQTGQLSSALIEKLEEGENANVHEFLTNPLLTSLLFKSFEYKRTIPVRKHIFYRQVFDALFETHDLMKEEYQRHKRSGLDIDQFDELLRHFCFITYKDGKSEYSKNELLRYLETAKLLTANKDLVSSLVVHDLTHGLPLMVEEGNYFRWVHRSMQEYFAALWICRDSKDKQLTYLIKMFKDQTLKHQNLLALCADIDPISFRRSVVKELAIKMIEEFCTIYSSGHESIPAGAVQERRELVTGKMPFIVNSKRRGPRVTGDDPEERKVQHELVEMLRSYCTTKGILFAGASWSGLEQAVGTLQRADTALLDAPIFHRLIPFIKSIVNDSSLPEQPISCLSAPIFIPIDDDLNNIVNSQNNFASVNQMISVGVNWRFDQLLAVETLRQIELEERESDEIAL